MRRTILLLATVALGLLLVGGVALGRQNSSEPPSTQPGGDGDVSIQSFTNGSQATFSSGSDATYMLVQLSDHGNLTVFESPAGLDSVFAEGYAVCSSGGAAVHGYDVGSLEEGFGEPTIVQPTAGAFPVTVTRNTTDGRFQLQQVWAKPDATEKDVTVTMTLKNISAATVSGVRLSRTADIDSGSDTGVTDLGARTSDSAFQWDDPSGTAPDPSEGRRLTALTFNTAHTTAIESYSSWGGISGTQTGCTPVAQTTPVTTPDGLTMRAVYNLGNMAAGQSKTVKFEYGRM
jgi:hypothetical protein